MIKRILRSVLEPFPAVTSLLRGLRDQLDQRDPPQTTPWGFSLAGNKGMAAGKFEPEETRLVRELLKEVDVLVNVGANIGYYCCHALSLGKPVVAIEPIARNLHYLLKNIQNNGWESQAQVFPVATGAATNILKMWGGGTGASMIKGWASIPESYVTQVPVLTLDRVLGNTLSGKRALILVDIEGAEFMMLQGAAQTLANASRPVWIVEITNLENQPAGTSSNSRFIETFEIFFSRGYRAFTADGSLREINSEIVTQIAAGKKSIGTYNFLFR
ncbi:MAG: FkbM family methyltransferase [Hylemonella sp.]